jgi:hypothetical protein
VFGLGLVIGFIVGGIVGIKLVDRGIKRNVRRIVWANGSVSEFDPDDDW